MARNNIDILVNGEWNGRNEIRKAERDIEGLEKAVDNTGRSTSFLDGAIGGLVGGGLVALSDQLIDLTFAAKEYVSEGINLATNAQETTNLLTTSLGPAYDGFISRIDEFAEATGRSSFELQELSSSFVGITKNAGFAADAAGDLAANAVQIATDIGSFFNLETVDAAEKLRSAYAGSSEPLQQLGIDVRELTLRQEALRAGIIATDRPLTNQERILAVNAAVTRQAADAMGDAARTADEGANRNRALESAYRDLSQEIGESLLPLQQELVDAQLRFIDNWKDTIVSDVQEVATGLGDILLLQRKIAEERAAQGRGPGLVEQFLGNGQIFLGENLQAIAAGIGLRTLGQTPEQIREIEAEVDRLNALEAERNSTLDTTVEKISSVTTETQRAYSSQRDYLRVIREQTAAGKPYFDSLEEKRRLEEAQAAVAERAAEAQRQLGGAFLESLETINSLETPEDPLGLKSFNDPVAASVPDLLFQVGQQAGLAAPQMAALALATGDYSREQINAALEAAIMEEAIGRLAEDVATGKTTIDEAELELIQLQEELRNSDPVIFNTASEVSGLNEELAKVDGDRTATVNVQINGLEDLERAVQLAERIGAGRVLTQDDPLVQRALNGRTVRQLSPSTTDDANSQGSWR